MKNLFLLVLVMTAFFVTSCSDFEYEEKYYSEEDNQILKKYLDLPVSPSNKEYDYSLNYPKYINTFTNSSINYDLATLGRVLFYDKNLSDDRSISCASCHKQELAFSDDVAFSKGVNGQVTARNSLALGSSINFNLYYGSAIFNGVPFFWDNSASTIQEQSKRTLANPKEMNMHIANVLQRVNSLEYYKPLLKKIGDQNSVANEEEVLNSIAEFTNSISNYNTTFDNALSAHFLTSGNTNILGKNLEGFTKEENKGKDLYIKNCASCHGATLGRPGKTEANNGIHANYQDKGVGAIKGGSVRFKVPTLRNILLTKPYMHDGSFATIDDVLDHYSEGIKFSHDLSPELRSANGNEAKQMNFSKEDKEALKAFFATLTDTYTTKDVKFSDPFIK